MPRSNFGCLVHAFGKRPHVWLKAGDCASKNLEGTEANHGLADAALALRGLGCMYELGGFRMGRLSSLAWSILADARPVRLHGMTPAWEFAASTQHSAM